MTNDDFLRAIAEAPNDDDLLSVYADWLEDAGDPRADLVRLQKTLSRLPLGDARRPALEARAQCLMAAHGDPLAGVPQSAELAARGWAKRVLRLSGRVRATVEYNGRGFGYDLVKVNGRVARRQVQYDQWSRFDLALPGPLGPVQAVLEARMEGIWLKALRLQVAGELLYEEGLCWAT
jgi:uncharacterized protein (TIGR02996 family)